MTQSVNSAASHTHHVDVLIIGAGLSGIGAACNLTLNCPNKSYAILERRQAIGGTWDLFRYPGIRSDSDMLTLGYGFKPWTNPDIIADGHDIREYIREAAKEHGVEKHIRFGRKVVASRWSTEQARWTVEVLDEASGQTETYTTSFLWSCTGYYNYDQGFTPKFEGIESYKGQVVHPQKWPEDLDYAGKKVVVIGSGATAITLVPSMADKAAHVTMLQRSPTYIMTLPKRDLISAALMKVLPEKAVYYTGRIRNTLGQRFMYRMCKQNPERMKKFLLGMASRQVGKDFDMKHLTPNYNPWDERLCVVPNGDLFKKLKNGQCSIVTDHIDTFTEKGIRLKSGKELEADIVVTATGLNVQLLGGMQLEVDGKALDVHDTMVYKGLMLSDVPNFCLVFGYTNASWTLKADLVYDFVCRMLNYMDKNGTRIATPRDKFNCISDTSFLDLQAGYVARAKEKLPKQGTRDPWKVVSDYFLDTRRMKYNPINDGVLEFTGGKPVKQSKIVSLLPNPLKAVLNV